MQTNAELNFEVKTSYMVTVGVRDTTGSTDDDTIAVTINVTNVNEPPSDHHDVYCLITVAENTATTTVIETYMASDPDTDDTLTWSLSGVDAGDFADHARTTSTATAN